MTLRIHSIRDFNTKVFKKSLYVPLDKQILNSNNSLNKSKLIDNNENRNINMRRNSLIQINEKNISQNILNKRLNSLVIIREKPNENSKDSSNSNSNSHSKKRKLSFFNNNKHNNYIYSIGSFFPKLMATEKNRVLII